jgi:hypothetical protein
MSDRDRTPDVVTVTINGEARPTRPSRRQAMLWVMGAVAAASLPRVPTAQALASDEKTADAAASRPADRTKGRQDAAAGPGPVVGQGYGTDPDLRKSYKPGSFWPLAFNDTQKKAATALADTIIPEDKLGPAASDVGVVDMIDEWISSPYPQTQGDRPIILDGLAWLDLESNRRFKKTFADIEDEQRTAICDDICYTATAKPEFQNAAKFFSRFRALAAGAYYATPAGWKAIGYIGNVQLAEFAGPPPAVLAKLGVEQTVK